MLDDAQVQDVGKKQRPAIRDDCEVALDAVNQASKSSPLSLRCLLSTSSPIILQEEENRISHILKNLHTEACKVLLGVY